MRKSFLAIFTLILITSIGIVVYRIWPEPPVETKFVTNSRDELQNTIIETFDGSDNQIAIKQPGDSALLNNPTHVYQTFNNCGPATLTMMLNWLGGNVSQDDLGRQMRPYQNPAGDNDDKTIFTYEFVDWAKQYGFESIGKVNGDIELLKTFVANGIPVVVKTWLQPDEDIGHFRIVTGFDERNKQIIQDDSYDGPNKRISYYDFLSMWQPFNYNYMIVYTPEQAPLVQAIIGEEFDENIDWSNSLDRAIEESELDPDNVYPYFNLSTAYYHLGEYEKSVQAFEKVESRLPRRMLWYQIEPIQSYRELGNYDHVFSIIDNILNNGNRAFSELYQLRGEIYLEQGNRDAARSEFEKAQQYNENYEPAKQALEDLISN